MTASLPVIDVDIVSEHDGIPSAATIQEWVRRTLTTAPQPPGGMEASVRVVDEAESQALNREYRGHDKPTNVLSFPAGEIAGMPQEAGLLLGDIVICAPVVAREAEEQGKEPGHHWAHMLVHGTLHLLGYDHQSEAQATAMEALEREVLGRFGVGNPYGASH